MTDELCGSFGCTLPKGHNMGKPDLPSNHRFDEDSLRADIVAKWGPAGAHVDVYDHILKLAKSQPTPSELKVKVCDALININDGYEQPMIPPTAIDWIGDAIVGAILDTGKS
jgi:hypothetical protein